MKKLLSRLLGKCRVWSAYHAVWWHREIFRSPGNEIQQFYDLAHKLHLFFYVFSWPWEENRINEEARKKLNHAIWGDSDIRHPE